MTITTLLGDCREKLQDIATGTVQTCVTSPPYFGLRNYGVDGQIGLEATPALFVAEMVSLFREVKRVLRDDGTLWLNLGDSYSSGGRGSSDHHLDKMGKGTADAQALGRYLAPQGFKDKDLLGIPWRVAFALQDDGWILRSDIVWDKPNCMPESVLDRPTRSHEYLFLFAKSRRYFYDRDAIVEPAVDGDPSAPRGARGALTENSGRRDKQGDSGLRRYEGFNALIPSRVEALTHRNRRSVWRIPTAPYRGAHFATFPEALVEPCILAGSSPRACEACGAPWARVVEKTPALAEDGKTCLKCGKNHGKPKAQTEHTDHRAGQYAVDVFVCNDVVTTGWQPTCRCVAGGTSRCIVLDPFAGSGTTLRVAERLGRDSIGIELNPAYLDLQADRTNGIQVEMAELY